jgi:hypothetical protein
MADEIDKETREKLARMTYHDRLVMRDWFAENPHYSALITEIDRLNNELMAYYGSAKKKED